jgi:hypothetical protein
MQYKGPTLKANNSFTSVVQQRYTMAIDLFQYGKFQKNCIFQAKLHWLVIIIMETTDFSTFVDTLSCIKDINLCNFDVISIFNTCQLLIIFLG